MSMLHVWCACLRFWCTRASVLSLVHIFLCVDACVRLRLSRTEIRVKQSLESLKPQGCCPVELTETLPWEQKHSPWMLCLCYL